MSDDRTSLTRPATSPSARDRLVAVVRAGHDGETGIVGSSLHDEDATVRAAAVAASVRLAVGGSSAPTDAAAALMVGFGDHEPSVRRRSASAAARWAGQRGPEAGDGFGQVAAALVDLLGDEEDTVVEVAAFACGELDAQGDDALRERTVDRLGSVAIGHRDPLCRESAVAALGSIGDERGMAAVLAACSDRANVRRRAVLALAAFDGPEATDELRRLTADRDLQVRQAAEELLAIEGGEPT